MAEMKALIIFLCILPFIESYSQIPIDRCDYTELKKINYPSRNFIKSIREYAGFKIVLSENKRGCKKVNHRNLIDTQCCKEYTYILYRHGCVGVHYHLIILSNSNSMVLANFTILGSNVSITEILTNRESYVILEESANSPCW
jgi:hypothetical protein